MSDLSLSGDRRRRAPLCPINFCWSEPASMRSALCKWAKLTAAALPISPCFEFESEWRSEERSAFGIFATVEVILSANCGSLPRISWRFESASDSSIIGRRSLLLHRRARTALDLKLSDDQRSKSHLCRVQYGCCDEVMVVPSGYVCAAYIVGVWVLQER